MGKAKEAKCGYEVSTKWQTSGGGGEMQLKSMACVTNIEQTRWWCGQWYMWLREGSKVWLRDVRKFVHKG